MNGVVARRCFRHFHNVAPSTTPLLQELVPAWPFPHTLRTGEYPSTTSSKRYHTFTAIAPRRQLLSPYSHRHRPRTRPRYLLVIEGHGRNGHGKIQKRSFHIPPLLSSFLPSSSSSTASSSTSTTRGTTPSTNNNQHANKNNSNQKLLTASRTLPYPASPLFDIIAAVGSYADFLPFLTASAVTKRDPVTKYPTEAFLTVGYGPLSETFTSRVICDPEKLVVEAKSGEVYMEPVDGASSTSSLWSRSGLGSLGLGLKDEGIFTYLSTKWELVELGSSSVTAPEPSLSSSVNSSSPSPSCEEKGRIFGVPGKGKVNTMQTRVQLQVAFEFKSAFHATLMSAVENQMADAMIEAFERRIKEKIASV
jgi:coenzyme Q-binding protein COQ10